MANSKSKRTKPKKPSASFPLTAHNNGQWCKKIRGKIHFFGTWEDPQAALDNYLRVAADLHAGRLPRPTSLSGEGVTIKHVCNNYLTTQQNRIEIGEITPQWFDDCRRAAEDFAKFAGSNRIVTDLRPDDFEKYRQKLLRRGISGKKGLGVHALDRSVMVVKAIFRTWADEVNDQHAIYRIMGHVIPGMSGVYVEEIELSRLQKVVNHVHKKLFNK